MAAQVVDGLALFQRRGLAGGEGGDLAEAAGVLVFLDAAVAAHHGVVHDEARRGALSHLVQSTAQTTPTAQTLPAKAHAETEASRLSSMTR